MYMYIYLYIHIYIYIYIHTHTHSHTRAYKRKRQQTTDGVASAAPLDAGAPKLGPGLKTFAINLLRREDRRARRLDLQSTLA